MLSLISLQTVFKLLATPMIYSKSKQNIILNFPFSSPNITNLLRMGTLKNLPQSNVGLRLSSFSLFFKTLFKTLEPHSALE